MRILFLVLMMGCTTGDLNFSLQDVFQGNVIASKNSTVNYTKIINESDEAKIKFKDYKLTDEDKALIKKTREEVDNKIEEHLKGEGRVTTVDFEMRPKGFEEFILANPKIQSARIELQLTYFYAESILTERFLVYECLRDPKRQLELFKKGASKVKRGWHNTTPFASACDGITVRGGKAQWNDIKTVIRVAETKKSVCVALKKKLNWNLHCRSGIDFKTFFDGVHFEIRPDKMDRKSFKG